MAFKVHVITQAAAATHASPSPGLFLLAWGMLASAAGLLNATNFRGFTDNAVRRAAASLAGLQKLPPWKWQRPPDLAQQVKLARLIGIAFAILGPIVTVAALISISHSGIGGSGLGALHGTVRYLFIAVAVAGVGWSWLSRRGLFRAASRHAGWRLVVAVLSSLAALTFGIGIAMGQMTIAIVAWVIGGLSVAMLMMEDNQGASAPGNVRE